MEGGNRGTFKREIREHMPFPKTIKGEKFKKGTLSKRVKKTSLTAETPWGGNWDCPKTVIDDVH